MTAVTREAAYSALFTQLATLKTNGTVAYADRAFRYLEDMKPPELPALIMTLFDQQIVAKHGVPPKRRLGALVYLYAANPQSRVPAGIQLNGLIDAVEACLAPPAYAPVQKLGGVVDHCWIEGTVKPWEDPDNTRAATIVPVWMMLP